MAGTALIVLALVLSALAVAPAADAGIPLRCDVQEEYVTEATLGDVRNGDVSVRPGAEHPYECYY